VDKLTTIRAFSHSQVHALVAVALEALLKLHVVFVVEVELKSAIAMSRYEFLPESLMVHVFVCPEKERLDAMADPTAISSSSVG
jgi:hypothetical protein